MKHNPAGADATDVHCALFTIAHPLGTELPLDDLAEWATKAGVRPLSLYACLNAAGCVRFATSTSLTLRVIKQYKE